MKKYYTKRRYKRHQSRIRNLREKNKIKRKKKQKETKAFKISLIPHRASLDDEDRDKGYQKVVDPVFAPYELSLLKHQTKTCHFFNKLRSINNYSVRKNRYLLIINLKDVTYTDFITLNALTAIVRELKNSKRVIVRCNVPEDKQVLQEFYDSGFLDHMFLEGRRKLQKRSDSYFFRDSKGKVTIKDRVYLKKTIRKISKHLSGCERKNQGLTGLILEMCGNAVEHSKAYKHQWLMGVKYEKNKVVVSITDIGLGILNTLHFNWGKTLEDFVKLRSDIEILNRAFEKKYGSQTKETNRNKGLPFIKLCSDNRAILNLKVATNKVILYLDNIDLSSESSINFGGTIYQFELDQMSFEELSKIRYDENSNKE